MKEPTNNDVLVETVTTAWRPRSKTGEIMSHPGWHDLPENERENVFAAIVMQRQLEAGLDSGGLSCTSRAVLDRIRAASR